jgi:hypothetical protein
MRRTPEHYPSSDDTQRLKQAWTSQGFRLAESFTIEAYEKLTTPDPRDVRIPHLGRQDRWVIEADRSFGAPLGAMKGRWRKRRPSAQEQRSRQHLARAIAGEEWGKRLQYEEDIAEGRANGVVPLPHERFQDWERRFLAAWAGDLAASDRLGVELERLAVEGGFDERELARSAHPAGYGRLADAARAEPRGARAERSARRDVLAAAIRRGVEQRLRSGDLTPDQVNRWQHILWADPRHHSTVSYMFKFTWEAVSRDVLLAYVTAHPGETAVEIGAATGIDAAGALLVQMARDKMLRRATEYGHPDRYWPVAA